MKSTERLVLAAPSTQVYSKRSNSFLVLSLIAVISSTCNIRTYSNFYTQAFAVNKMTRQTKHAFSQNKSNHDRLHPSSIIQKYPFRQRKEFTLHSSTKTALNDNNSSSEKKRKLSRPERKALERQKKQKKKDSSESVDRRYNLHSRKVSVLCKSESTADDVVTAIKRAQNRHDVHDIRNIAKFLLNEVDASFAYGYRGSLLARLAVAALHMSEHDSAWRAIELRRKEHRKSILPMESAAIIRGLLRVHNVTDAMTILQDELPLPEVSRIENNLQHKYLLESSLLTAVTVKRKFR